MAATEEALINVIAKWERSIDGVKDSFDAFKNPNNVTTAIAPCVLHFPPSFSSVPTAHHNRWKNTMGIKSVLLVAPRASKGANLSYLENMAMPFLQRWRLKFQTASVITDVLSVSPNITEGFLVAGSYGVGGQLLTINNVPWIGCLFDFTFTEIA